MRATLTPKEQVELVSLNQLAAIAGVSNAAVYRAISAGVIVPFGHVCATRRHSPRPVFLKSELPELVSALNK